MVLLGALILVPYGFTQESANSVLPAVATCTFEDSSEMSVRYNPVVEGKNSDLPNGKIWPADPAPSMVLFAGTELRLGNATIPLGAYSLYVIPGKQQWTIVVNHNVTPGAKYDEKQDIVRAPMEIGSVGSPSKEVQLGFGRTSPKQCGLRFYFGKVGAWVEFQQK
jgi:hypothetical protein